jgi:hypothetical protein
MALKGATPTRRATATGTLWKFLTFFGVKADGHDYAIALAEKAGSFIYNYSK